MVEPVVITSRNRGVGQVVATEDSPSFEKVVVGLNAGAIVKPGQLVYVLSEAGRIALVARVDDALDVNPHESAEHNTARKALGIKPVYAPEGRSTVIRREFTATILNQCDVADGRLGEPKSVETLPRAGWPVFVLSGVDAARILGFAESPDYGIVLGELEGSSADALTPAILDYERVVPRHLIVVGRSGSGKSYADQVIIEDNVRLGVPTISIDLTNDLVAFADDSAIGGVNLWPGKDLKVPLATIGEREVLGLASTLTDNQRELVGYAYNELLRQGNASFSKDDLLAKIDDVAPQVKVRAETLIMAKGRIGYAISSAKIIGDGTNTTDWAALLKKYKVINVPCRQLSLTDARIVAAAVCRQIQALAQAGKLPPVVVSIDEAHYLVPADEDTTCKPVIRELIRVGRHYGVALIVASQFPRDLDRRTIGQANTYLVFALDRTQLDALAGVFADATDQMIARLPKLPRGVCLLSGGYETVSHAAFVQVRERRVAAGGAPTPKFLPSSRSPEAIGGR